MLRPNAAGTLEEIDRAGIGFRRAFSGRPDGRQAAPKRNGKAKDRIWRGVGGGQFRLLGPDIAGACKNISRARSASRAGGEWRADDRRVPGNRNRAAKVIHGLAVGCDQFGLLAPGLALARKNICRASIAAAHFRERRADESRVARERNGLAEPIAHGGIRGGQFGLLDPGLARTNENIGRAGAAAFFVFAVGAHNRRIARQRNRFAKIIARLGVAGRQFLLHRPRRAIIQINIGRSGAIARAVVPVRPDDRRAAGDRNRNAKLVVPGGAGIEQLLLRSPSSTRIREDVN
ncbi:MAG: hypothetical protein BWZ10_02344 [candidate division BRC1 bacterium ADurb.BinA364]|nr:MAG: hypothetical protein BWZ10_02344 [candidate division BRC1 bacterium ADurb.BinA364]